MWQNIIRITQINNTLKKGSHLRFGDDCFFLFMLLFVHFFSYRFSSSCFSLDFYFIQKQQKTSSAGEKQSCGFSRRSVCNGNGMVSLGNLGTQKRQYLPFRSVLLSRPLYPEMFVKGKAGNQISCPGCLHFPSQLVIFYGNLFQRIFDTAFWNLPAGFPNCPHRPSDC